ncbi:HK97-gp10 family putative phage morphogenesis protein [Moraxella cuniculi]|nr:HK97-gp10 family putative phage morphogenesis protein [Moraxella cuniculi]
MVEYGTRHHRAQPFIRPAFDQNEDKAVERFKAQLAKNIKKHTG